MKGSSTAYTIHAQLVIWSLLISGSVACCLARGVWLKQMRFVNVYVDLTTSVCL